LAKAIAALESADVQLLAGSTRDLLNVLATLSERQAGFRSLSDQWGTGLPAMVRPRSPKIATAADLSVPERVLLFCVASGTQRCTTIRSEKESR
jgi:hypothetical protein